MFEVFARQLLRFDLGRPAGLAPIRVDSCAYLLLIIIIDSVLFISIISRVRASPVHPQAHGLGFADV